jgi:hypothetical protein
MPGEIFSMTQLRFVCYVLVLLTPTARFFAQTNAGPSNSTKARSAKGRPAPAIPAQFNAKDWSEPFPPHRMIGNI